MDISSVPIIAPSVGSVNFKDKSSTGETGADFRNILSEALGDTLTTEAEDRAGTVALLTGEDAELHNGMIETTKAELALNLAIQIRNKVIDAYSEIMRMSI